MELSDFPLLEIADKIQKLPFSAPEFLEKCGKGEVCVKFRAWSSLGLSGTTCR